ncbi:DEAD/DEAH box helicase [Rubripirellula lacrimiformis]|uniref:DEAD/DEAH box helicase n=1 Tax=Rubripirellula lacrimiformis TaxID=1930273 RepID=UPI001C54EED5|nr:DEAD/DEAH box helicase [Rubripirellula lacrimiformis]
MKHFETADKETRKRTKTRKINLRHLSSVFYGLLLLRQNSPAAQKKLRQIAKVVSDWRNDYDWTELPLSAALAYQTDLIGNKHSHESFSLNQTILVCLLSGWNRIWYLSEAKTTESVKVIRASLDVCRATGADWFAAELAIILSRFPIDKNEQAELISFAKQSHQRLGTASLGDFIQPAPIWDSGLTALENLCAGTDTGSATAGQIPLNAERMIWELQYSDDGNWIELYPIVQKLGKKGWSKGRKVALGRLYENWQTSDFGYLTQQDRDICQCMIQRYDTNPYGYRETYYEFSATRVGKAIVDHPSIFHLGERDEPIQITETRPHLTIEQKGKRIKLAVQPTCGGESMSIQVDGSHRISVVQFSDRQKKIAELISNLPTIPADQQARVAQIARSIAAVIDVQSDIEAAPSSGEAIESSHGIVAQLTPYQDGLRAELFVQPLGAEGPFCRPGVGAPSVFASVGGKSLTTTRDLDAECDRLQLILTECRPLEVRTSTDDQTEWLFDECDDALELVVELQKLADQGKVTLLWPRGKSHQVAGQSSNADFRVSLKQDRDWFAASGKLTVDDELTLDLMTLLDLASAGPSRFVKLDDGRFLELTHELRQRVSDIAAFGTTMKNKVRFAPVRALVVDSLLEDTQCKTDKHWKSHLRRIQEASTIPADPPSTLQASLRDYQVEGYAWLRRLSHWNTGACLADDMGLGKTIQALGLLIERAPDGPALIVAPASVGFNWESETRKFAPTLTPKLFRDCDRDQFFDDIHPGDLIITSYGLLQSEIDRFTNVHWRTILLDEAQAIKNADTKRSQAVMQLEGDFKVILTGTPMENHLGELWNLFRFVVPGLLGSSDQFRKSFAIPIERDNCRDSRRRLKRLIQPFLLRRTKTEVLSELPARSETVLEVEMSPAEVALYEALRRKAIENITASAKEEKSSGEQHLQVLAELTRLRLACCHPSLVGGDGISGSKLALFGEKVSEVVDGKHKVLVFSQFVKHLSILRDELDGMGVSYQYLDGSTSMSKRKEAVESFQAGKGDVFLISLKAGGTGLNLTAADYVFHMDPWWNPAVEDQATDRAHRIGQQRPVNVYRFINRGTIEEQIVDLHHTKRDLADSLLAGTDRAGKLSTADLIALLKDHSLEAK